MDQKEVWRMLGYLAAHGKITVSPNGKYCMSIPSDAPQWAKDGLLILADILS